MLLLPALAAGACAAADTEWRYEVRAGDNPWNLTTRYLDGIRYWPRLQRHNGIDDARRIAPGTRLRIPEAWLRREPAPAHLVAIQGSVTRVDGVPLQPGAAIDSGAGLRTAAASRADIEFADGSRLRLFADSELWFQRLQRFANTERFVTETRLTRGRSEVLARDARASDSRFELSSPASVTSVRGTEFRVDADDLETRTGVVAGTVAVASGGVTVAVPAGFGTVSQRDRQPATPIALLPAPDIGGLPSRFDRVPIELRLQPVPGAAGYRLRIAAEAANALPLFDEAFTSTALRGPVLPNGVFIARVRPIDAQQLEGHEATHAFRVHAHPEPPFPIAPSPAAVVADERPEFRWANVDGALAYRFELARTPDFAAPLATAPALHSATYTPAEGLPPGVYYWRVTAADGNGPGPRGDTQVFRRPPPGPTTLAPAIGNEALTVRWRAAGAGETYRFQLADEPGFATPRVDTITAQAEIAVPVPPPGSYLLRVATIDSDGFAGSFGPAQRLEVPQQRPSVLWWLLLVPLALVLF
jgi:hypothetical protein